MPQPETPLPSTPDAERSRPTARQVATVAVVVAVVVSLAVIAYVVFDNGESALDTEAAADRVNGLVGNEDAPQPLRTCPVDVAAVLEAVSEDLGSDIVFDVLDLDGQQQAMAMSGSGTVDGVLNCTLVRPDPEAAVVLSVAAVDDTTVDDFLSAMSAGQRGETEVDELDEARGGRLYAVADDEDIGSSVGAIWIDDNLAVSLAIAAEPEPDVDPDDIADALTTILPDVVDELAAE